MKKHLFLSAVFVLFIAISCNQTTEQNNEIAQTNEKSDYQADEAKNLMVTNCNSCHGNITAQNRIAPSYQEIKTAYLAKFPNENDFIEAMKLFLQNPVSEKVLLKESAKKFGIMPNFGYPEKNIDQIAQFIFQSDMTKDYSSGDQENTEGKSPGELGLSYALSTKAQLGKNLMQAIQAKGTANAVEFCNIHAYPITDSLAKVYNLSIKRVSDKPRNPENKANETEIGYINHFKNALANGVEITSMVEETETLVNFYYPILTNGMCLQCHGEPETQVDEATLKQLNKLYPNDLALGYAENQVRGIWSISWNKEQ